MKYDNYENQRKEQKQDGLKPFRLNKIDYAYEDDGKSDEYKAN
ncbi:MAG: hypothetical protein ABIK15_02265 [Pseudomonadota bacterium]